MMKNNKLSFLLIGSLSLITLLYCKRKDELDKLSESDKEYFETMQTAYDQANVYNDSLIAVSEGTVEVEEEASFILYCDSMFHHHQNTWNHYHNNYSHDDKYCDHGHEGGMMHHRERRRRHEHDYSQSHHQHHHDQMHQLEQAHASYHP